VYKDYNRIELTKEPVVPAGNRVEIFKLIIKKYRLMAVKANRKG